MMYAIQLLIPYVYRLLYCHTMISALFSNLSNLNFITVFNILLNCPFIKE